VKNTKDLKLRTSIERLANYLLRKYHLAGEPASFDLQIEKRRLASFLGMTPENLSRSIKSLQAYGVEIDGSTVRIKNAADLAGLAKPTRLIDDSTY
jgi:CRP/FNR family transcriptional activator FtrB